MEISGGWAVLVAQLGGASIGPASRARTLNRHFARRLLEVPRTRCSERHDLEIKFLAVPTSRGERASGETKTRSQRGPLLLPDRQHQQLVLRASLGLQPYSRARPAV